MSHPDVKGPKGTVSGIIIFYFNLGTAGNVQYL
jgi:hypothetical protein